MSATDISTDTPRTDRRPVQSFDTYREAQAFVDSLADRRLPVEEVAIVGSDLRVVEQVTGRMTTGRAALAGAGTGAWFGLLLALFIGIFLSEDVSFLGVLLYWTIVGAVFGAALGAISHALRRGQRDFSSYTSIQPRHFEVHATERLAGQLRSAATRTDPMAPPPPRPDGR